MKFTNAVALSFLLLSKVAEGMVELTEEMLRAGSLEEFLQLEHNQSAVKEANANLRQRMLQNSGYPDSQHILADHFGGMPGFYHGVASGDPLPDSVIVWTRYTPVSVDDQVSLEFRMAKVDPNLAVKDHLDPAMNPKLFRAQVLVTSDSDFIAKIDVTKLDSASSYVFAFSHGESTSTIGRTKTAPSPDDKIESMVYAVFSCAHFANGYFHAYDVASTIKDLDFWIHVGDYVYEYGLYSTYASNSAERKAQILPIWEQISLQDHRNRMATYHTDEGLQNLHAAAPLIATWDDHETMNNPWGDGTKEGTGAENHQEVCPVGPDALDNVKSANKCDRDELPITERLNNAAQAYFEWMPIRHQVGNMGVVTVGDLVQKISWGDLATVVTFDSRISHRSKDPTLNSSNWGAFFAFAGANTNVTTYADDATLAEIAQNVRAVLEDPIYTMIGEDINILKDAFQESKNAGQTWQIWAQATALGRAVKGDFSKMHELIDDEQKAAEVESYVDALFPQATQVFGRALVAMAIHNIPWNRDDYSGFANEQRQILAAFDKVASNPIVLGGDLHDGYAWQLYEGGAIDGKPVAVNLVCPGVTSPGWGPALFPGYSVLGNTLGSVDEVYALLEKADEAVNPGLKYYNLQYKGFFAVKATKTSHIAEYFNIGQATILQDYNTARTSSGSIVANFFCDTQLTTTAGVRGSLERSDACGAIEFETTRSPLLDLPFPSYSRRNAIKLSNCGYLGCDAIPFTSRTTILMDVLKNGLVNFTTGSKAALNVRKILSFRGKNSVRFSMGGDESTLTLNNGIDVSAYSSSEISFYFQWKGVNPGAFSVEISKGSDWVKVASVKQAGDYAPNRVWYYWPTIVSTSGMLRFRIRYEGGIVNTDRLFVDRVRVVGLN